jgi:SNF2 family DNA or RNA helicase
MTWDTFKDMYAYELYSVHGHPKYSSRIRNLPLLKREVAPYMIRHLKAEVGIQLPPKRAQRMPLFMLPEQVAAYRDAVRLMMIELSDGTILDIPNIVAKLTRLRQITSGLATIKLADGTPGPDISAKLDAAMELIEDRAGDPIVVFSMFRETIKALGRRLTKAGVPWSQIMAEMSSEEVSESKERFAQGGTKVMIGTIGVGGVGHTLTAADTLIFIDKHYNPDHQLQAEDRIHRIGQQRPCLIISLHVNHTVDDFVESIVTGKELMTRSLMTHSLRENLEDSDRFL